MLLKETRSTTYHLEDGMLISRLKRGHTMNLQDAMENLEARQSFDLNFPVPILIDIQTLNDASFESLIATTNPKDASNFNAAALLVCSSVHEVILREARRFKTTALELKVFKDEAKARDWLSTFL